MMKHIFITYGDDGYELAKSKICEEAKATGEFDEIIAYGRVDLSDELLKSDVINIKRGGGLWSWKPDVIWKTMQRAADGDIIVYCDSGCTIQNSKEWNFYWNKLGSYDIIAQRIPMRTDKWTRKEVLEEFKGNKKGWNNCYQYEATTVFLRVSAFTRSFISEWRKYLIMRPDLVMDVTPEEKSKQHATFIENRHDQSIYSALIYKYCNSLENKNKIYTCWERIEDCNIIFKQAVRATRLRLGENEPRKKWLKRVYKRFVKHRILIPFIFAPRQWWFSLH